MRSLRLALVSLGTFAAACASGPSGPNPPHTAGAVATAAPSAMASSSAPVIADEQVPRLRLPSDVRPKEQTLALRIDPRKDHFGGATDIDVTLTRPRTTLWLHGKGIRVHRATVTQGESTVDATWAERDPSGVASVTVARPLAAGEARIHLEFETTYSDGDSAYRIERGGAEYVFTQFEATYARRAFPCFDEPSAKIPFAVTLDVPTSMQAIANMPEEERAEVPAGEEERSTTRIRFAKTPPIPSYLVAFAVGPFDVVDGPKIPPNATRPQPLPLRGVAVKGRGPELAYALARTGKLVTLLETYFGIAYPYPKLDLIGVPDKPGAMENPGAITTVETLLLLDEAKATTGQKEGFSSVMAHELAHQWFGDLVTMAWWDDTWLNEAFASWMAPKISDGAEPRFDERLWMQKAAINAMRTDALPSARAIRQPIASDDDIQNAFDGITYNKGAGVIAMFERWVGEARFRAGVRAYLTEHRFGNATADDFLAAIGRAAGRDVATPWRTFLDKPGVPFVAAEARCDGTPRVHLTQTRDVPLGAKIDASSTWQIPVCVRLGGGKASDACTLLGDREADLPLEGGACPAWVFPNADGAGYFQAALRPEQVTAFTKTGVGALKTSERVAYAAGLRASFDGGALGPDLVLPAAAALTRDEDNDVAGAAMRYLHLAREWSGDAAQRAAVEASARTLYRPVLARVGMHAAKGEPIERTVLRRETLTFLGVEVNDPAARDELSRLGRKVLGNLADGTLHAEAADPDLRRSALGALAKGGDAALFDALVRKLVASNDMMLRSDLVAALGGFHDPSLAARARELALDAKIRPLEAGTLLWRQLGALETREAAWGWALDHFDALLAKMPINVQLQLADLPSVFCDDAHAEQAEKALRKRADAIDGGPRALAESIERVRQCAAVRAKNGEATVSYFTAAPKTK